MGLRFKLSVTAGAVDGHCTRYDYEFEGDSKTTLEQLEAHAATMLRTLDEQAYSGEDYDEGDDPALQQP